MMCSGYTLAMPRGKKYCVARTSLALARHRAYADSPDEEEEEEEEEDGAVGVGFVGVLVVGYWCCWLRRRARRRRFWSRVFCVSAWGYITGSQGRRR
jgi:hypothetical protein